MQELSYVIEDLKEAVDKKDWDSVEECVKYLEKIEEENENKLNREFFPNEEEY
tara:strand:- start:30931 stop:31089 length:159 start_codon:yes stop_codon:yes gene_type:complete